MELWMVMKMDSEMDPELDHVAEHIMETGMGLIAAALDSDTTQDLDGDLEMHVQWGPNTDAVVVNKII